MPSNPEKRKEQRRGTYERHKMLMATNPEYAETYREARRVIEKNRRKKTTKANAVTPQASNLPASRMKKPGRLIALCGWRGW